MLNKPATFQELITRLQQYWDDYGCVIMQPIDLEVGAGTFHPATFLNALGPDPWNAAYVQQSRRPTDGRYGEHPNRSYRFHQYQVVLKPCPLDIQQLYLNSLAALGIDLMQHDIRFVEDNWESPTLGAWGLGWEVWLDGMEITQFTYFQQVGGIECNPIMGEITYGLERIAMCLQHVDSFDELIWQKGKFGTIKYSDLFKKYETQMSAYNFEHATVKNLFAQFNSHEQEANNLLEKDLPHPAYELVIKASHVFNLLDARSAISVTERQGYILRIRNLSKMVAKLCC